MLSCRKVVCQCLASICCRPPAALRSDRQSLHQIVYQLLAASPPHLRPIVVVALNTGMRRGEILRLTWENVDFGKRVITVEQSKSGRIRHIPMNFDVTETLKGLEGPRSGPVFRWHGDSIQSITRSFGTALRQAGIRRCRFHDLRHRFATNLVLGGVDLVTVKELLGHADISMTMRYAHPSPETKRKAVDILSFRKESGTLVAHEAKVAHGGGTQVLEKKWRPRDDSNVRQTV